MREKLLKKGDKVVFPIETHYRISRMLQDMNQIARIDRIIDKDQVLFSLSTNSKKKIITVTRNF